MNEILRGALLKLRKLCMEVTSWQLFEYSQSKTYTLDDFVTLQVERHWLLSPTVLKP